MAKCKFCKKEFTQFNSTISVCGYQCAIEWGKLHPKKTSIKRVNSQLKSEAKEKLETYSQKVNKVKVIFQKWIRERDKNEPCISCGTLTANEWHASHFKKAETYSGVIFNEINVWKSCKKCNVFLNGNELNYRERLVKKIGLEQVIALENLANETRTKKWTLEELQQIKTKYKKPNQ
jgi:hypothetical protein